MGTERDTYYVRAYGNIYQFQGAKYIYQPLRKLLGVGREGDEGFSFAALDAQDPVEGIKVKRVIPRLTLVLVPTTIIVGGNGAQTDNSSKTRRIKVFCDPDKMEDAIKKIKNKTIGGVASAALGISFRPRQSVKKVYISLRRNYD